jgi:hypothetical protein
MLGFLNFPTDKNLEDSGRTKVKVVYANCLRTQIDINSFPSLGVGNSILKFVQAFWMKPVQ